MADLVRPDGLPVFVYRRASMANNGFVQMERMSLHDEVDDRPPNDGPPFSHRCVWRNLYRGGTESQWLISCRWSGFEGYRGDPVEDPIAWLLAEFTDGADGASADVEEAAGDALADRGDRA